MRSRIKTGRSTFALMTGLVMTLLMTATVFAATTPPIRSGEYKTPARTNYEFQGWYLNPEGTGDMVIDKNGNWLVDLPEDTEVFAKWKQPPTILLPGEQFNLKLKRLAGSTSNQYRISDSAIKKFQKSTAAPTGNMTSANIISTTNSAFPAYAWFSNGTIYWWSEAEDVQMNPDSSHQFYRMNNLNSADLSDFNTSKVTNMNEIFADCYKLRNDALNISGWDTSNVTNMHGMFWNCETFTTLDVSNIDTSSTTDMSEMFLNCKGLQNIDLSSFDTSKVTNMFDMFCRCAKLTSINMNGWNTANVTNMSSMFYDCNLLTDLDVSNFDMSKVTTVNSMFYNCKKLSNIDVSHWDTSNVTSMGQLFCGCQSLTSVDVSGFDTSKTTSMSSMFKNCTKLTTVDVSNFDTSNTTGMSEMFYYCYNLTEVDVSGFDTSKVTNMSKDVKRRKFAVLISDFIDEIDFNAADFIFPT